MSGLQPGDRVAAQVEKSPEALALYLGTIRAGGVFLPLNPAYLFVSASQDIFFHGILPNMDGLIVLTAWGHGTLLLALGALRFLEKDVRDFL